MIKGIQIGKKYHISVFHFFMVSVLVFKIILMGLFSSDYQNLMFMRFVNGFLGQGYAGNWFNPYEYFYQEPGLFPYPPVMLAIECVGGALSLLAGKVLLLKNILFKLPNLVFDCLGMYYLMKLFPGKRKYIGVLYFASPIIIYSTYMHGQLDIIPTALFLGAISYLVSPKGHNGIKYILFLASSIACKFHILAAIPILFFFIGKRDGWKKAFLYTATPFALAFVCVLPFWGKGFLHNVLLNHEQAILTKITIDFSSVKIYIPVLAVILIYLHVFTIAKINRDLLYSFCGILFSIFLVLIPPMPGWYVWIIPFITIYFIDIRSDRYRNLVIYLFLNFSYLFYFVFAHHTSYVDLYYLDKSLDWIKADAPLARNGLFTVLEAVLSYSIYMMYQSGIASNSLYKRRNMPFTIGVSGDSGSGKSTFISMAEQVFGQKNLLFIEGDGDHKWERGNAMWKHFTHLNPKSNFLYRQARDLATLKSGQSVLRVDYDHSTGRFTKQSKIRPKPFILLCGLHALYLPQIRNSLDLKIYMDIDENLRRYWKIQRDVANRGYSKEKILEQISSRLPDAEKYIYPQRKHADLVVTYFDKHLKDCLVDGHTVKLSLKVTVNMELDLEDFIQIVENHGIHVEYDYNADLEKQSVIFESTNLEQSILPISSIAEQTVPHLDEIINHPLEGLDDLHGILAILLLMLIGEKMRGGGVNFVC